MAHIRHPTAPFDPIFKKELEAIIGRFFVNVFRFQWFLLDFTMALIVASICYVTALAHRRRSRRPGELSANALRPIRGPSRPLHFAEHDLCRRHRRRADAPSIYPLAKANAAGSGSFTQPLG